MTWSDQLWKRCLCSLVTLCTFFDLPAQIHVFSVRPDSTDPSIRMVHGANYGFAPPADKIRHKLLFMIEGTESAAKDLFFFDTAVAALGYSVISVDYPNNVNTVTCANSQDSMCFDKFRQEIVFGTPVSPIVQVDSVNSLYNRFVHFLRYLAEHDPGQGWDQFIEGDRIEWNKVIVGGHSQGAGHAAYFGKKFPLDRVLIFSGPQDYLSSFFSPARWLYDSTVTDVSRYYAFLHTMDPYNFGKQRLNCEALMHIRRTDTGVAGVDDTLMVSPGVAPENTTRHIFVTNIQTANPHGSTLGRQFLGVISFMLGGETKKEDQTF